MAVSFTADIRPLFRDGDIECMKPAGVHARRRRMDERASERRSTSSMRSVQGRCRQTHHGRKSVLPSSSNGSTPAIPRRSSLVAVIVRAGGLSLAPLGMRLNPAMGSKVHEDGHCQQESGDRQRADDPRQFDPALEHQVVENPEDKHQNSGLREEGGASPRHNGNRGRGSPAALRAASPAARDEWSGSDQWRKE